MADENGATGANADDVKTEITLDDFNADEQAPAKAEPSPAPEAKAKDKPEAKDTKAEAKGDDTPAPPDVPTKTDTEDQEEDQKEDPKVEETETEDSKSPEDKPTKADERKAQLNEEIRDLVSQRNSLRTEVEEANAEVYQPATESDLSEATNPETGEKYTKVEAKVEAMRQEREMEKYNNQVAEAQLTIGHESQRVLQDFPIFNPDADSYDKELATEAAELLAGNLIIDPNTNQVIGSNVSPYQLYKTLARASGISAVKGEIKGQANTEKQLANVDAPSSAGPPSKPQTAEQKLIDMWKSDD